MGTFILLVFIHVGALGDGNSNSGFSQEFHSQNSCVQAGNQYKKLAQGTVKVIDYVCVPK
jgi:hypothetical protein